MGRFDPLGLNLVHHLWTRRGGIIRCMKPTLSWTKSRMFNLKICPFARTDPPRFWDLAPSEPGAFLCRVGETEFVGRGENGAGLVEGDVKEDHEAFLLF